MNFVEALNSGRKFRRKTARCGWFKPNYVEECPHRSVIHRCTRDKDIFQCSKTCIRGMDGDLYCVPTGQLTDGQWEVEPEINEDASMERAADLLKGIGITVEMGAKV